MVFKRRDRRPIGRMLVEFLYPKGGWARAITYVKHRMRRLPDQPHRIARGIFAGVFVNFPPLFGVQMASAALIAWAIRGNIIAALLSTFLSNPITTPFIALMSVELGQWMLGIDMPLDARQLGGAILDAGHEIWDNVVAIFTSEPTQWHRLERFFHVIFLPYAVGSIIPGIIVSVISYYLSLPVIHAYQRRRDKKRRERLEKRIAARAAAAEKLQAEAAAAEAQALADSGTDRAGG